MKSKTKHDFLWGLTPFYTVSKLRIWIWAVAISFSELNSIVQINLNASERRECEASAATSWNCQPMNKQEPYMCGSKTSVHIWTIFLRGLFWFPFHIDSLSIKSYCNQLWTFLLGKLQNTGCWSSGSSVRHFLKAKSEDWVWKFK